MTSTKLAFRVHKFVEHEMYEVHVSRSRFGDVTTRVTQGHAGPTLREAATLRTASVAAPPLAAKPETLFRSLGALLAASAPAPATPSVAGARLSPATQDAYEPASVLRHSHVSTTDLSNSHDCAIVQDSDKEVLRHRGACTGSPPVCEENFV